MIRYHVTTVGILILDENFSPVSVKNRPAVVRANGEHLWEKNGRVTTKHGNSRRTFYRFNNLRNKFIKD